MGHSRRGWGPREGGGEDVDASPPSSVAIEQQQGLPYSFCHWLAVLTKSHVVQMGTNEIKAMLLS